MERWRFFSQKINDIKQIKEKILKEYNSQYKQLNEQIQNEALKMLIQNKLTIVFYKYEEKQEMPDIVFRNWENLFKIYKSLGGNDYVDSLNDKIKTWRTTTTDVFK